MMPLPSNMQMYAVIARAYGAGENIDGRNQTRVVAHATKIVLEELDSLTSQLQRANYTPESYDQIINTFHEKLALTNWQTQWNDSRHAFQLCIMPLRLLSESLPAEESPIDPAAIKQLEDDVNALRQSIRGSDLPDFVKDFVLQELAFVSEAIRDYPMKGAKAFKHALRDSVFHDWEESGPVKRYTEEPTLGQLRNIRAKLKDFASVGVKTAQLLNAVKTVYELGSGLFS